MEHFDFPIREETLKAIADMGYEAPTPIQALAIPPLMEKRDVIGQAQTGTGKTVAFGIPMIECVDESLREVQGLVLSPTRELAMQTAGEIAKLAKYRPGLSVLAVYGGQPIERQLLPLKRGVQIVVGTPGRVIDHIDRGTLSLDKVRFAVLDEADEMLDMGFRDDIETILSQTPEARQTALFSATMPFPIMSLAQKYLKEPALLRVENQGMTVEAVKQTYIPIRSFHKVELLSRLLVRDGITRALVFMNTKLGVEEVVTKLQARGFAAAGLHGDMRQIERDAIMERFKKGTVGILVATDVAARGLDIENVEAVFNYDIPLDVENYVHRVGRTGRAGKEGRAYTFVVGRETSRMWDYRKVTKAAILCEQPPSGDDIRTAEEERLLASAREKAETELSERLTATARKLLETTPAEKAVAALIELLEAEMGAKIEPELDLRLPEPPKPAPRPLPAGRAPGNRRYGRPAPDFTPADRRFGRPAPDANPADRRFGCPAPDANPAERRFGRPVPDANPADRRFGRPAPDANPSERRYGRPVTDGTAAEHGSGHAERGAENTRSQGRFAPEQTPHRENRFERRRRMFGELPTPEPAPRSAALREQQTLSPVGKRPAPPWPRRSDKRQKRAPARKKAAEELKPFQRSSETLPSPEPAPEAQALREQQTPPPVGKRPRVHGQKPRTR